MPPHGLAARWVSVSAGKKAVQFYFDINSAWIGGLFNALKKKRIRGLAPFHAEHEGGYHMTKDRRSFHLYALS